MTKKKNSDIIEEKEEKNTKQTKKNSDNKEKSSPKKTKENNELKEKTKKTQKTKKANAVDIVQELLNSEQEITIGDSALLEQIPQEIGLLSLRENVLFNSMIMPIYETREEGIKVIEEAYNTSKFIFVTCQKNSEIAEPTFADLYTLGTVGLILRMIKLPNGHIKALVQGISRAKAFQEVIKNNYSMVKIELIDEVILNESPEIEALIRTARENSEKILQLRGMPVAEIMGILSQINDPGKIADLIASNTRLKAHEAQAMLECLNPLERLKMINSHLLKK